MEILKIKNEHAAALGKIGGKIGGLSKSEKKASAARKNGAKGGRKKLNTAHLHE